MHDDAGNGDGLPNTVMEISLGTPLVATRSGGSRHRNPCATALLFPGAMRPRWPGRSETCLDSAPSARAIGMRRSSSFCREHSWDRVARDFEAVYDVAIDFMTLALLVASPTCPARLLFAFPSRPTQASCSPAEERVFWSVMISVIISTTGAFVLAASGVYTIGRLATLNVILTAALAAAALGRLRMTGATRPTWTALLPVGLIALGTWMYFAVPASEYILGGRDPGVYMTKGYRSPTPITGYVG